MGQREVVHLAENNLAIAPNLRTQIITATKADRYKDCPARYKAEVIDQIGESDAFRLASGNLVHRLLRDLCAPPIVGQPMPDIEGVLEDHAHLFRALDPERRAEVYSFAESALWAVRNVIGERELTVLAVERDLQSPRMPLLAVSGAVPTELRLILKGRVDLIAVVGRKLVLVDWKTGRYLPLPEQLETLPSSVIYEFLGHLCYVADHPELQIESIEIAQVQVSTGAMVATTLTTEVREAGKQLIREMAVNRDRNVFPERRNLWCDWCPINGGCSLYRGDFGEAF